MKKKEQMNKFRSLEMEEVKAVITSSQEELMRLRFRLAGGQLEQTAQLVNLRRKVAQAKTVLAEKRTVS